MGNDTAAYVWIILWAAIGGEGKIYDVIIDNEYLAVNRFDAHLRRNRTKGYEGTSSIERTYDGKGYRFENREEWYSMSRYEAESEMPS